MSDFWNKARDALGDNDDNPVLDTAEQIVGDHADDGAAVGSMADKGDEMIDQIQGTKD